MREKIRQTEVVKITLKGSLQRKCCTLRRGVKGNIDVCKRVAWGELPYNPS